MRAWMVVVMLVVANCGTISEPAPVDVFCREYAAHVCYAERVCGRDCEAVPTENRCLSRLACLEIVDFWDVCFAAVDEYQAAGCRDPLIVSGGCPIESACSK